MAGSETALSFAVAQFNRKPHRTNFPLEVQRGILNDCRIGTFL
jgi:hypothetical protein